MDGRTFDDMTRALAAGASRRRVIAGITGAALGAIGSSIVALQKSEPSLEDVFVELVGRGFEESEKEHGDGSTDRLDPPGSQPPDDSYVSSEPVETAR